MNEKIKIALASPEIKLADPKYNARLFASKAREAAEEGADVIAFPELALTGATLGDLFKQKLIIDRAECALYDYIENTKNLSITSFVGLPIAFNRSLFHLLVRDNYDFDSYLSGDIERSVSLYNSGFYNNFFLFNAVAVIKGGEILSLVLSKKKHEIFDIPPKKDVFVPFCGQKVNMTADYIYKYNDTEKGIKTLIGSFLDVEDTFGLTEHKTSSMILNITSESEYVGYSHDLDVFAGDLSFIECCPVLVVGSGEGESGTDGIYAAERLVARRGAVEKRAELFSSDNFYVNIERPAENEMLSEDEIINMDFKEPRLGDVPVKHPFIPEGDDECIKGCELAFKIQSRALAKRMERSRAEKLVIGVSGGLDSTVAVLAAAYALDVLGLSRKNLVAITMPCFGTTERTKNNALALASELGCTVRSIDIKNSVNMHFDDISHNKDDYNVVYENAQARERTQVLMDIANEVGALVVGTGDLSELALGFATYNGDHMSMYAVNASIPKTFLREMIRRKADALVKEGKETVANIILDVVNTPVSPELLPSGGESENKQYTEKIVGPYELHDFFLYYTVKRGIEPGVLFEYAKEVFLGCYTEEEIKIYFDTFLRRFYSQQFKRSCMPDGPRVTDISLSPRGAWRMPSDVDPAVFRRDLNTQDRFGYGFIK